MVRVRLVADNATIYADLPAHIALGGAVILYRGEFWRVVSLEAEWRLAG